MARKVSRKNDAGKQLQADIVQLTEDLKKAQADLINYRTRVEREKAELLGFAKAQVIRDFLPVVDSFERLLQHISTVSRVAPWKQGVEVIGKQIEKTLADMGVERIKAVGEAFDPHLHEAVSVDGDGDHEIVSEELQAGYKLGDDIIRHATVKVKAGKSNV